MYWSDHHLPHFRACYGDEEAVVEIETLSMFGGHLPARVLGLVVEWASAHHAELLDAWTRAESLLPLQKIEPLA
jgi:hypothetical protein